MTLLEVKTTVLTMCHKDLAKAFEQTQMNRASEFLRGRLSVLKEIISLLYEEKAP